MQIIDNIKKQKKNIALISENNEFIDYKTLLKFSDKISLKIKERSLVFLLCGNNVETISGYLSFLNANCVVMMLDEKINTFNLNKLISIYKPNFIYLKNDATSKINNCTSVFTFHNYSLVTFNYDRKMELNEKLSLLISTSGSTGSSKNVRQSHENLYENTKSIIDYLNIEDNDIGITTLPMSYVYGLSIINTHLTAGGCIVLNNNSVIDKKFWAQVDKNKITNFGGVPYTYEILDRIGFYKFDLKYLKYTTQAGGKLSNKLNEKIINDYQKKNKKFFTMYGAAEATARMSYLPWEQAHKKIGSIGLEIPGGKFWIEDSKKNKIDKKDHEGELIFSGKNVCLGYANTISDLAKGDENMGVLRTGDIAKKDNENFYYIVGRKDRYTKIFGMRVNLAEIEYNLSDLGIKVICKNNTDNKITIFVTNKNDSIKLKEYLPKLTLLHSSVFVIKIIDKLPLNENYKISYTNKNLN